MRVLSIDTATNLGSVAIVEDDKVVVELEYDSKSSHAEVLLQYVETVLKKAKCELSDLNGIAVTIGPGSFTGLRIGLATAKGLAIAAGKPLVGVSTLAALNKTPETCNVERETAVVACMNAHRDEVYADESVISPSLLADKLSKMDGDIVMVGDGAVAYKKIFEKKLGKRFKIAKHSITTAAGAGLLALPRFKEGRTDDIAGLLPNYIRRCAAEEKTKNP